MQHQGQRPNVVHETGKNQCQTAGRADLPHGGGAAAPEELDQAFDQTRGLQRPADHQDRGHRDHRGMAEAGKGVTRCIQAQYPITPVELGEGFIVGKEKILSAITLERPWSKPGEPKMMLFDISGRQIDAADAQEDLRLKKMEKLRYAQRLLEGRLDDPEADARYEFTGNPDMDFAVPSPNNSGDGGT